MILAMAAIESDDWYPFEEVEKQLQAAFVEGAKSAADKAGVDDDAVLTEVEVGAVPWAREHAAELVGKKYVAGALVENPDARFAIDETTRDGLRRLIGEAIEHGWSNQQLAAEIRDAYTFSPMRASMIARTEINRAFLQGAIEMWEKSGLVHAKQWVLASTHSEPDECDDNEADGPISLRGKFSTGVTAPPAHPLCKCSIIAVLKEK